MSDISTIEFVEDNVIEIDYSDDGFLLQSPSNKAEWWVKPLDPDLIEWIIYAPEQGIELREPEMVMGIEISPEKMEIFEQLRKAALQEPPPSLI